MWVSTNDQFAATLMKMMRVDDLREMTLTSANLKNFVPRVESISGDVQKIVSRLINEVRNEGSSAISRQSLEFDGAEFPGVRVPKSRIKRAATSLDGSIKTALLESIRRVRAVSEDLLPSATKTQFGAGGIVTARFIPVDRAGVYAPGGSAIYPSSVIMNVVAAQAAGVPEIVLVSPPQKEFQGEPHPLILATAHLLGVSEVYAIGGAGAVAAMTWGVPDIDLRPVSMITGPGNQFVAAAKSLVIGEVGIDSEAGPSEICILADETASPELIAADLISQAEHDELASAVLVTDSSELVDRVSLALERRVRGTPHHKRVLKSLGGSQSAMIIVNDLGQAVALVNEIGPEHLEVMAENPERVARGVRHAGAVFIGDFSPVSAGDYMAGSNHVLPTSGTAKFSSGLSPLTFLRLQQSVRYDRGSLAAIAESVIILAEAENLPAHGAAIRARTEYELEEKT